jgi:hypothetical protein
MTFLRNGDDSGARLGILEGCEHSEIRLISMSEINLSTHYRPSRLVNLPDFAFSFNFISACRLSCRLHDLETSSIEGFATTVIRPFCFCWFKFNYEDHKRHHTFLLLLLPSC